MSHRFFSSALPVTYRDVLDEQRTKGVICCSAGNHAQAVSYHATQLGIRSVIVMPEQTPYVKIKKTSEFGGQVVMYGNDFSEAYQHSLEIAEKEDLTFVHAFNDPATVAGQGSVALEMLEQNAYLDAIVVPVGGGGLIAGMALAIKSVNPRIKVYGVEAIQMPGMYESLKQGQVVDVPRRVTITDGMAVNRVGEVCFELVKEYVDDIVLVDESEIAAAVLSLCENECTVVEGSGATSLAAVAFEKLQLKNQNVGLVVTGGNIDMTLLGRIIEKGLVRDGRLARFYFRIEDRPGQLQKLIEIIAENKGNIRDIAHERVFLLDSVISVQPIISVDTRGPDHIKQLMDAFETRGIRAQLQTEVPDTTATL